MRRARRWILARGRTPPGARTARSWSIICWSGQFPELIGAVASLLHDALLSQIGSGVARIELPLVKHVARSAQVLLVVVPNVFRYIDDAGPAAALSKGLNNPGSEGFPVHPPIIMEPM